MLENGLQSYNDLATARPAQPVDFDAMLARIGQRYPVLGQHIPNVTVQRGQDQSDRFMEFYPPWERDNPNPGRITLEMYDKAIQDPHIESLMAGDMLHHLGSIDPRTGKPVDPEFLNMKSNFIRSMTQDQHQMNQRAYAADRPDISFDDWMHHSRADAYLRGGLFPDANPDWQRPETFTPQQSALFGQMRSYLSGKGSQAPLPVSPDEFDGRF